MKVKGIVVFILMAWFIVSSVGPAAGKSVYLSANHHTGQFDAWNINPDGTVNYQATYNLMHSTDPAGIGIDAVTVTGDPVMFISSEFSPGIEIVNPVTLEYMGVSSGPSDLAGVDVDDVDDIVYSLLRADNDLYVYTWDPVVDSLTQQAVIALPGMSYGYGIALDDSRDILWVTDTPNYMVRAYDVNVSDWTDIVEIPALSFSVSHPPIDIAVDTRRNLVYTVGAWAGSPLLSKYDVATGVETTKDLGVGGIGVAADETNGYVYMTRGTSSVGDDIQVWDCSTSPFTLLQDTPRIGNPAGIAIGNVSYNPLNLAKNDAVVGYGVYIGQTFTYEITCDNLDNAFDITGVTIVDNLPMELDFISETVDSVPGTGIYDPPAHTVTWNIGTVPAGQTGPLVELVVRINQNAVPGGTIYNYCTIESDQTPPTTVEGMDPDDTTGQPGTYILPVGVELSISPNAVSVTPGETADYTLSVWNKGGNPDDYSLRLWGLPSNFAYSMPDTIQGVGGNDTAYVPLAITPPHDLAIWFDTPYPFTVACTSITYPEASNDTAEAVVIAQANSKTRVRFTDLLLDSLIAQVEGADIQAGVKNSLLSKLGNARKKKEQGLARLEQGDTTVATNMFNAAANILGAFINELEAQRGRKITEGDADSFMAQAEDIIWRLQTGIWEGGSPPPAKMAGEDVGSPQRFELSQNIPNPFNPTTQISYTLPRDGHVKLQIYNLLGQKVTTLVDRFEVSGYKAVLWDGTDDNGNKAASGVYFYRIQADEFTDAKKMVLMK